MDLTHLPPPHKNPKPTTQRLNQSQKQKVRLNPRVRRRNLKNQTHRITYTSQQTRKKQRNTLQKKLDTSAAKQVEHTVKATSRGSTWNTGATMEQFDYSDWMKKRIEALLLGLTFSNSGIKITEVVKVEGSATILLVRGKYRPGYDISFECKWKGYVDPNMKEIKKDDDEEDKARKKVKQASGVLRMNEITSEDDPDDWEYEVSIKKKSKMNKNGLSVVKKDRERLISRINVFVKELQTKK
eukprot:359776_1